MARAIYAHADNKVAIIKISDGGTSLQVDWNSRRDSGNVWWQHWVNDTTEAIGQLKAMGYSPVLKVLAGFKGNRTSPN